MQHLALCRMYIGLCKLLDLSYSHHDAGVLIPAQHGILTTSHLGMVHICPSPEEVFMRHYTSQTTCKCAVDIFHNPKVGWEQDVEVALVY